jgi:hypothetical protein
MSPASEAQHPTANQVCIVSKELRMPAFHLSIFLHTPCHSPSLTPDTRTHSPSCAIFLIKFKTFSFPPFLSFTSKGLYSRSTERTVERCWVPSKFGSRETIRLSIVFTCTDSDAHLEAWRLICDIRVGQAHDFATKKKTGVVWK